MRRVLFILVGLGLAVLLQTSGKANAASDSLRGGWTEAKPYQSLPQGRLEGPQGLDIDILADTLELAGLEAHLHRQTWSSQLEDLIDGNADIALGAFKPAEGDDRFHYSLPYRWARIALQVRAEDKDRYGQSNVASLIGNDPQFHVGAIPGRLFEDEALNRSLESAAKAGRIVYAQSDEENLQNLLQGRIDGFVTDRLGATAAARDVSFSTAEIILPGISGVHLLLSKKTVPPETLARINAAISTLETSGQLKQRLHTAIFNVIMSYALGSTPFMVLGIVGTLAFAVSGVLIAYRENFSFFGALVLSALPAVGGGALRDIVFDRHPIGTLSNPLYLLLVGITVLCGFIILAVLDRVQPRMRNLAPTDTPSRFSMTTIQEVCDAAGLAAFTVSGFAVAVSVGAEPLWLWGPISAMLTAAGGGILRDVVRQSGQVGTLKSNFYAEIPLFWGLVLAVFLLSRPAVLVPEEISTATIITCLGAFITRLAVVAFGINALPFRLPRRNRLRDG